MELSEQAGFLAAHAVWCVAEGETLVPFVGTVAPDGTRQLRRFVAERLEDGVAQARELLSQNSENSTFAVLIYDGFITLPGGKTDALFIEARAYGLPAVSLSMAVPYRHASHAGGFVVYRPKFLSLPEPAADVAHLAEAFFRGVDSHQKGGPLWNAHLDQRQ